MHIVRARERGPLFHRFAVEFELDFASGGSREFEWVFATRYRPRQTLGSRAMLDYTAKRVGELTSA